MSDVAQGPGWWQASDGRWYPPEAMAQAMAQAAVQTQPPGPDAEMAQPQPAYGQPPDQEASGYTWPEHATAPAASRSRGPLGALLVLLGVAGLAWGVGELFAAVAINNSAVYPHDEQIGAWIVSAGILLAGLTTIVIGLVHTRR
jgi:hypothetical protein